MDKMVDFLRQPWPWYVAGVLIGLTVPALMLMGNRSFGISANLRHICAAVFPSNLKLFQYPWKREIWNLLFAGGIIGGAAIAATWLANPAPPAISAQTLASLQANHVHDFSGLAPADIFSWEKLGTLRSLVLIVVGGFLVGFGTRYAGGCTSGHSISGLSHLQWPSLVATICFMAGGFLATWLFLPFLLSL